MPSIDGLGKHDAAVDRDGAVAVLDQHHVEADLAEPAERNDAENVGAASTTHRAETPTKACAAPGFGRDVARDRYSASLTVGTARC